LDGSDLQALADHGHTIISAAGMLGFADLSRAARLLEDACREGAGIDAARDAFRESRSIALVHIEALLTGLHEKAARTGTRAPRLSAGARTHAKKRPALAGRLCINGGLGALLAGGHDHPADRRQRATAPSMKHITLEAMVNSLLINQRQPAARVPA
jgi:HPt (histidine-containing phosphotransfer) domain-containing protein